MKSEEEIRKRIEWVKKAINDPDNDTTFAQCRLYAQLDQLKWVLEVE